MRVLADAGMRWVREGTLSGIVWVAVRSERFTDAHVDVLVESTGLAPEMVLLLLAFYAGFIVAVGVLGLVAWCMHN